MITKTIVSEQEKTFVNVLAAVIGEDEKAVNDEIEYKFRQFIKDDNELMSDEDINECVENEFYYNKTEGKEFGLYIMTPDQVVQV